MKKIKAVSLLFLPLLLLAQDNKNISQNIIESSSKTAVKSQQLKGVDIDTKKDESYHDATVLNWLRFNNSRGRYEKDYVALKTDMIDDINATSINEGEPGGDKKEETITVKGYCFIDTDVNVGKQPSSIFTACQTNVGPVTMFSNIVAINEKFSLLADPKYIEKNGYRFSVKKAIVTNEDRTSYNIATFANDRKISEIGWSGLEVSSDEVKDATNEYLKALQESKKKESTEYLSVQNPGDNSAYVQPQTLTNTEKPSPSDYFVTAGIDIAASVIKSTAAIFKRDLPYLYEIKKNSKIWINMEVNKKGVYVK